MSHAALNRLGSCPAAFGMGFPCLLAIMLAHSPSVGMLLARNFHTNALCCAGAHERRLRGRQEAIPGRQPKNPALLDYMGAEFILIGANPDIRMRPSRLLSHAA